MTDHPIPGLAPWTDPQVVARYAEGPARIVPGLDGLHKMAGVLLAETCPPAGRVLVLGAGGGLELTAFARAYPGWRFDGVDPSGPMLALAHQTMGADTARATLHEGYIDSAPDGPFDAGICLLTLHFLPKAERLATLRALHKRLAPNAAFVCAHHSVDAAMRMQWLERCVAYASTGGGPAPNAKALNDALPILSPDEDAALLAEAGFKDVALFYAAFTFRGWVAHA